MHRRILALLLLIAGLASFGLVRTTISYSTPIIGTTATTALAANKARNFAEIWNVGGAVVWCKFGEAAVVKQGFFIPVSSSGVFFSARFEEAVSNESLSCIGDGSESSLTIGEGVQP